MRHSSAISCALPLSFALILSACGGGNSKSNSSSSSTSSAASVADSSSSVISSAISSSAASVSSIAASSADASSSAALSSLASSSEVMSSSSLASAPVSSAPVSSASSSSSPATGEVEISASEFEDLGLQDGVWRIESTVNFAVASVFELGEDAYPYELNANFIHTGVKWQQVDRANRAITQDLCNQDGVETEVTDEDSFPIDTVDLSEYGCTTTQMRYFKLAPNEIRVDTYCDGRQFGSNLLKKVSDADEFTFGSMSFNANIYSDAATSSNLCGNLGFNNSRMVFGADVPDHIKRLEEASLQLNAQIILRMPYGDDYLFFTFTLNQIDSPEKLVPGTYEFGELDQGLGFFGANVSSREFGVDEDGDPDYEIITGGTLTISAASKYTAIGSYNLTTGSGDNFSGEFALDLND